MLFRNISSERALQFQVLISKKTNPAFRHGIDEPVTDAFLALDYHFMDLDYALPVVQIEAKLTSPN